MSVVFIIEFYTPKGWEIFGEYTDGNYAFERFKDISGDREYNWRFTVEYSSAN